VLGLVHLSLQRSVRECRQVSPIADACHGRSSRLLRSDFILSSGVLRRRPLPTEAAIKAGFSPKTADQQASRLSRNVKVRACLEALRADRAQRMQVKADEVLAHWLAIARAEPNELIEVRRICCRYCHGKAFRYQRTQGEMEAAQAAFAQKAQALPVGATGIGYDARKAAHPHCRPECFGEGVGGVPQGHATTGRLLSPVSWSFQTLDHSEKASPETTYLRDSNPQQTDRSKANCVASS
jgi:Terminase small subunit